MKRVISYTILAASVLFLASCGKKTENTVPEPDTETSSAVDAAWATFVVSDIETQCSFMAENLLLKHFYTEVPGTAAGSQGTMTATRDISALALNMAFNKTHCIDGRLRDGTIFMNYGNYPGFVNPRHQTDSEYGHSYGFNGFGTFSEYKVDGWKIELADPGNPMKLVNTVANPAFNPSLTPLTWSIQAKLKMTDSTFSKIIIWEGSLVKTCLNSTSKTTFSATSNHKTDGPVIWDSALVSYSGMITGQIIDSIRTTNPHTATTRNFSIKIDEKTPIIRDFKCFPNPVAGVVLTATSVVTRPQAFHPFKKGIATLNVTNTSGKDLYPRQLYFGNEGSPELGDSPCDNTGEILIKGITYKITFKE